MNGLALAAVAVVEQTVLGAARRAAGGGLPDGRDVVWRGRSRVGAVGAPRRPEVGEDAAHDGRVLDGGDDAEPGATAGTEAATPGA